MIVQMDEESYAELIDVSRDINEARKLSQHLVACIASIEFAVANGKSLTFTEEERLLVEGVPISKYAALMMKRELDNAE